MYRLRVQLPIKNLVTYRNLDLIHDAIINGWDYAGAPSSQITGMAAKPWNFAALGWRRNHENLAHTLVVSTPDPELAGHMRHFRANHITYARAKTSESVDFSKGEIFVDPDPLAPGQEVIGVVMLSPLCISRQKKDGSKLRWHNNLDAVDLSEAINHRLSRIAGREVRLSVEPDRLYIRTNPRYDTLVQTKEFAGGRRSFVIGMRLPLVIKGCEDDLRLAWYAGIGEKNRNGFGCIGLAEKGVGR